MSPSDLGVFGLDKRAAAADEVNSGNAAAEDIVACQACETGGTRQVLPPRSLKRFTFKVCLNLKINLRSGLKNFQNGVWRTE